MTARDVVSAVRISQVWRELGGPELRRGPEKFRGRAWWRAGDGHSVALDDARGCYFDHRDGEGGGLLDLVVHVRGGTRHDALNWVAGVAGITLDEEPLSPEERAKWAAEQRKLERLLPAARYWRRAAVCLGEQVLNDLKAALFCPTMDQPAVGELGEWTFLLAHLRRLKGLELAREYNDWRKRDAPLVDGMVQWARIRERAEIRALITYLLKEEAKAS